LAADHLGGGVDRGGSLAFGILKNGGVKTTVAHGLERVGNGVDADRVAGRFAGSDPARLAKALRGPWTQALPRSMGTSGGESGKIS